MFRRRHAIRSCLVLVTLHGCLAAAASELPTAEEILRIHRANAERLTHLHLQVTFECENSFANDPEAKRKLNNKQQQVDTLQRVIKGDKSVTLEINGEIVTPEKAKEILAELVGPEWEKEIAALRAKTEPYRGVTPMELFIDGADYQFRRPADTFADDDEARARLKAFRFPTGPVTVESLKGDYRDMSLFSHSAQADPPSRWWLGHDKPQAFTSKKELGDHMNVDLPPFAAVMSLPDGRSAHEHPIDGFFAHRPEQYRVVALELVDGRMLTVVELTVDDNPELVYLNEPKLIYLYRAWLDPERGALPLRIEERVTVRESLALERQRLPSSIMTTRRIVETPNGAFYPAETNRERWETDSERRFSDGEWDEVCAGRRRAPELVTQIYRWDCKLVEIKTDFAQDFFVIPFPPGQKVYDHDAEPKERKPQVEIGQQAPPLSIGRWLDGKQRTLEDLKGQVVVLNFWGLWCSGCVAEAPQLQALEKQFKDRPVTLISIHNPEDDLDDLARRIAEFQKKNELNWIAAIDAGTEEDSKTGDDYGVIGLPLMVIVGKDGKIVYVDFMADSPDENDVEAREELEKKGESFVQHSFETVGEKWPISDQLSEEEQRELIQRVHGNSSPTRSKRRWPPNPDPLVRPPCSFDRASAPSRPVEPRQKPLYSEPVEPPGMGENGWSA